MEQPFFSIIVPTDGRDAALDSCLEAISRLDYPAERFEVIVVYDGGRPVQPPQVGQLPVRLLTQPRRGPAAARNAGAAQARGAYLAFTDDDCLPAADWLNCLAAVFEQYPQRLVGGRVVNGLPENTYAAAGQLLVDFLYEQSNNDPLQAQFFTSNNIALRRDLFLASGGFDTTFTLAAGEDREFCRRWLNQGYKMVYEPMALVQHIHHLGLAGFWRQHVNYGRGAFRFRRLQARQQNERLKLEQPLFYVNLLRYPFQRANGRSAIRLFTLFLIMQAANTIGFLQASLCQVNSRRYISRRLMI